MFRETNSRDKKKARASAQPVGRATLAIGDAADDRPTVPLPLRETGLPPLTFFTPVASDR